MTGVEVYRVQAARRARRARREAAHRYHAQWGGGDPWSSLDGEWRTEFTSHFRVVAIVRARGISWLNGNLEYRVIDTRVANAQQKCRRHKWTGRHNLGPETRGRKCLRCAAEES